LVWKELNQKTGIHGEPEGTAVDWTTDVWPSEWGDTPYYDKVGYGVYEYNTYGRHYWAMDIDMDCSNTENQWFEVKSYISNMPDWECWKKGGNPANNGCWEGNVNQEGTPYKSANHFAKCGMINVFKRGSSDVEFKGIPIGEVEFSFDIKSDSDLNNYTPAASNEENSDAKSVALTVVDNNDNVVFDRKEFKLNKENGVYKTKPIPMKTGTYSVNEYFVLNRFAMTSYASPVQSSEKSSLVSKPLPIKFDVSSQMATETKPEVIRVNNSTPSDYGYEKFMQGFITTFSREMIAVDIESNNEIDANIKIYGYVDENVEVDLCGYNVRSDYDCTTKLVTSKVNDLEIIVFEKYKIVVSNDLYADFEAYYTKGELSNATNPLVFELKKAPRLKVKHGNRYFDASKAFLFKAMAEGYKGETKNFKIINAGGKELEIKGINVSTGDFSVSFDKNQSTTLKTGEDYLFNVTFHPKSAGSKSATIKVHTNDNRNKNFNFRVSGVGKRQYRKTLRFTSKGSFSIPWYYDVVNAKILMIGPGGPGGTGGTIGKYNSSYGGGGGGGGAGYIVERENYRLNAGKTYDVFIGGSSKEKRRCSFSNTDTRIRLRGSNRNILTARSGKAGQNGRRKTGGDGGSGSKKGSKGKKGKGSQTPRRGSDGGSGGDNKTGYGKGGSGGRGGNSWTMEDHYKGRCGKSGQSGYVEITIVADDTK